jgi:hypothetical protein
MALRRRDPGREMEDLFDRYTRAVGVGFCLIKYTRRIGCTLKVT